MSTLMHPNAQIGEDKKKVWSIGMPLEFSGRKFQAIEKDALLYFAPLGEGNMGRVDLFFMPKEVGKPIRIAIKSFPKMTDIEATKLLLSNQSVFELTSNHPNLLKVLDIDFGTNLIMMEALSAPWKPLDALLSERDESGTPLNLSGVRALLTQLARGVQHLHSNGLLHRDIKPSNIMVFGNDPKKLHPEVEASGRTKLLDFDLVKEEAEFRKAAQDKHVICSPVYVAPEIIKANGIASFGSDIYSLGIVAYELILSYDLFSQYLLRDKTEILREKARGHIQPPANMVQRVPQLSANLADLLEAMVSPNPAHRPKMPEIISTLVHG